MGLNRIIAASAISFSLSTTQAIALDSSRYINSNWGFSVVLPKGLAYETNPPPNPNHGFKVPISKESFVWVNAESSDDQSLADAVGTELDLWLQQGCTELKRCSVFLGRKPAEQILLKCPPGVAGSKLKRVSLIIALESSPGINNTVYTIGVTYPQNGQVTGAAIAAFDAVRRGFRFAGSQ